MKRYWILIACAYCGIVYPVAADDSSPQSTLHSGIVVEQQASVTSLKNKSARSRSSFVLELMDITVFQEDFVPDDPPRLLLYPSRTIGRDELAGYNGLWVLVYGSYTDGGAGIVAERLIMPFLFDNLPDEFAQGLARFKANEKFGFFNEHLEVVIPARLDFALPFSEGFAPFCSGCKKVMYGEHFIYEGGKWGYIDQKGLEVISPQYEDAGPFEQGEAQVIKEGRRQIIKVPEN